MVVIIYIFLFVLDAVAMVQSICMIHENRDLWKFQKGELVLLILIMVIYVGIGLFTFYVIVQWIRKLFQRKKQLEQVLEKTLPYRFDYLFELKIYRDVGEKEAIYEKYSDWKKHILETYGYLCGNDDFYRFMKGKRIGIEIQEQINYSIMIPFVVAIVPFLANWFSAMTTGDGLVAFHVYLICLLLFAWLISIHEKKKMVSEKYFIKDVVEVLMQGFPRENPSSL